MSTSLKFCKTKSCIFNRSDLCIRDRIYIDSGRCGNMRSNKVYNPDGSMKEKILKKLKNNML